MPAMRTPLRASLFVVLAGLDPGWGHADDPSKGATPSSTSTAPAWLVGDLGRKFVLIEKHLRGLDVTMVEVGQRYVELYWAGKDRNWGYAEYQLGKIELALSNGVERRPKRAASARMLEGPIQQLKESISGKDTRAFEDRFVGLTAICNACHQAEQVPFVTIAPPTLRTSPVVFDPEAGSRPDQEGVK